MRASSRLSGRKRSYARRAAVSASLPAGRRAHTVCSSRPSIVMRTPLLLRMTEPTSTRRAITVSSVCTTPRRRISCRRERDSASSRGTPEMVTAAPRLHSITVTAIGTGTRVFAAAPVRGAWRRLASPDDVLALMDSTAEGVVACVADAGATFLAPIFDELTAVVCLSGTPLSHIGIVSREYQVPCLMAAALTSEPADGDAGEGDVSAE